MTELEGVCLAGQYVLQQWLGRDETGVYFLTSLDESGSRALVKIVPEQQGHSEEQLARWRRTLHLAHPHLLQLLDCGQTEALDGRVVYAVFEYPEESLADALDQGSLNETEVQDVLTATLDALRYIHAQGLVHTAIAPNHIVAVGDSIKVASDTLRDANGVGTTHADDVRALGSMLYQLLTKNQYAAGSAPDLAGINEPLRTIITHAADPDPKQRWTLAEIETALHPAPPPVQPAAEPEPQAVVEPEVVRVAPPKQVAAVRVAEPAGSKPFPKWLYLVYGGIVVAGLFLVNRKTAPEPQRPEAASQPKIADSRPAPAAEVPAPVKPSPLPPASQQEAQRAIRPAPPAQQEAQRAVRPVPPPAPLPKAAARGAEPQGRRMWRVIAYMYLNRAPAAKKVQQINQQSPDLKAEVFTLKGRERTSYLVALGGRMTHEEALRLQTRAVSKGMPRDTFVQNYSD